MRGEKGLRVFRGGAAGGSPPRARGEALLSFPLLCPDRITPACAGRRMKPIARILFPEDHPRVRGEKSRSATRSRTATGSPPRARGEGGDISDNPGFIRITPACAGRSGFVWYSAYASGDHPRVCGEKKIYNLPSWNLGGSPPRVRGEGLRITVQRRPTRITPACAGRSCTARGSGLRRPDHPRVCGEKSGRA